MKGIKGLIAAAIMVLPIAGTAMFANPASAEIIIRPGYRTPVRTVVQAPRRAERRVWVGGHWDYSNHHRRWVPGHYEYRR